MEGSIEDISIEEVKQAVKGMKIGKVAGSTAVVAKQMKNLNDEGLELLRKLLGRIVQESEIPVEWYTINCAHDYCAPTIVHGQLHAESIAYMLISQAYLYTDVLFMM